MMSVTSCAAPRTLGRAVRQSLSLLSLTLLSCVLLPASAHAQLSGVADESAREAGSIKGVLVTKDSNKPAANVTVTIRETGQSATTDRSGRYEFDQVTPGTYTLIASGENYGRTRITDVVVRPGHELSLSRQTIILRSPNQEPLQLDEYVVSARKEGIVELQDYEVTGRKEKPFTTNMDIPRTINDAQPYYIFDRKVLDRSGAASIEDFLRQQLTMNTSFSTFGQRNDNNLGNISQVNLRGLGTNKTLILVNGRRSSDVNISGTSYQPDLNGIPMAAIERVEVLPTSASGIYGGSAIGGVINIILKRDYSGGELRATYDNTWESDTPARTLSAAYGWSLEGGRTKVMLTVQLSDSLAMRQQDRLEVMERGQKTIIKNDPSFLGEFLGAVPNITSFGTPLVLKDGTPLNASLTSVPPGTSPGTSSSVLAAGLLANAGRLNLDFPASFQSTTGLLAPYGSDVEVESYRGSVRRKMSDQIEAFVEFAHNSNYSTRPLDPIGPIGVPDFYPINPFRQWVYVITPHNASAPTENLVTTDTLNAGLTINFPYDWVGLVDYTRSVSRFKSTFYISDYDRLDADLSTGALNPFVDTIRYAPDFQKYFVPQKTDSQGVLDDMAVRATGPAWHFPWGAAVVTAGVSRRIASTRDSRVEETYPLSPSQDNTRLFFGQRQTTDSFYVETTIPIITNKKPYRFARRLDLQIAGRSESSSVRTGTPGATIDSSGQVSYSRPTINGQRFTSRAIYSSTNPTVAVRFQPVDDLTIRASFGSAFLPPTYQQLLPNPSPDSFRPTILDPKTNTSYTVSTISGGNPALVPLSSKSYNVGIIFDPKDGTLAGLRFNVEYYSIDQNDVIGNLSAQQIVNLESTYPGRVTRDPITGRVTTVDASLLNLTRYETQGIDFSVSKDWKTGVGTFTLSGQGTRILHERRQNALGAPLLDYVNYPGDGGPIRFKGNGALTWEYRSWSAGWAVRYYCAYMQRLAPGGPNGAGNPLFTNQQGSTMVPSQLSHDAFVSYTFSGNASHRSHRGVTEGLSVQVGVKNVFNQVPPFDAAMRSYFYVSPFGDIRLRTYQLSLRKQF